MKELIEKSSLPFRMLHRIDDTITALGFKTAPRDLLVHTCQGDYGTLQEVRVVKGEVDIKAVNGRWVTVRAREVADIDDPI